MSRPTPMERIYFNTALAWAKKQGLPWEFLTFYRRYRKQGESICRAVDCANWEWDL